MNGTILNLLRCLAEDKPKDCCRFIPGIIYMINSTVNSGHGISPYTCLYGRSAPFLLDHTRLEVQDQEPMSDMLERILEGQKLAYDIALKSYESNCKKLKDVYDSKIKHTPLTPGDVVYHCPVIKDLSRPRKLQTTMGGPVIVLKVYDNDTADIKHLHNENPSKSQKHVNMFKLKRTLHYQLPNRAHELQQNDHTFEPLLQTLKQPVMVRSKADEK